MELKKNVQERRYERLKQIREQDDQWNDPEYVWKHRDSNRVSDTLTHEPGKFLQPPTRRFIWGKMIVCAILFGVVWMMFHGNHPLAQKGKQIVTAALSEEFDFAVVAAWYERTFEGVPSFIPTMRFMKDQEAQKASLDTSKRFLAPIKGKITIPFTQGVTGIVLETPVQTVVSVIDEGRVIAVNGSSERGTTVTVQHVQGYQSTYGGLNQVAVKENDWLRRGESVGLLMLQPNGTSGKLYLSIKKNKTFIDPTEVIHFD